MAAVRDALSIAVLTGMGLVVIIGLWGCAPNRRRAEETALREILDALRRTIAAYRADHGRYPDSLAQLLERGYLRTLPRDPVTGSHASWIEIRSAGCARARLVDVRSGAAGQAEDGTAYRTW